MDVTTPEDSEDVNVLPYAVVRFGNRVVKSSPNLQSSEADNMRFIAANTNIPILRVYEDTSASIKSITMEYIPGESLDKVWGTLLEEQKLALAAELKQVLSELRGLKGRYIGALNRGQAMDVRKFDLVDGPFDTEAAFNDFLLSDTFKAIPTVMHDMASRSLRTDHEIVFTHGDFAPRNIIVKDGKLAAIIDSEFSGWYP